MFLSLEICSKNERNLYESAKLRALHARVPTCLVCVHAHVPCVLACLRVLRAYMPCVLRCLSCLRAIVPWVLRCSRICVPGALKCSRVNVFCVSTRSHDQVLARTLCAHVSTCLACFVCSRAITTNDKYRFSITCFPYIFVIVLCLFLVK